LSRAVVFLPAARLEIISAHDWYERELPGLGLRFREELDFQVGRIAAHPQQFPLRLKDVRSARLRRFPYSLFFRATDTEVAVVACFHASRDPMVWRGRA
jgi:plasmid stabilization system protein ParE